MSATIHQLRPRHLTPVANPADEPIGPAAAHLIQAGLHAASAQRHIQELADTALEPAVRMELTLLAGAQAAVHAGLSDLIVKLAEPEATA